MHCFLARLVKIVTFLLLVICSNPVAQAVQIGQGGCACFSLYRTYQINGRSKLGKIALVLPEDLTIGELRDLLIDYHRTQFEQWDEAQRNRQIGKEVYDRLAAAQGDEREKEIISEAEKIWKRICFLGSEVFPLTHPVAKLKRVRKRSIDGLRGKEEVGLFFYCFFKKKRLVFFNRVTKTELYRKLDIPRIHIDLTEGGDSSPTGSGGTAAQWIGGVVLVTLLVSGACYYLVKRKKRIATAQ